MVMIELLSRLIAVTGPVLICAEGLTISVTLLRFGPLPTVVT
jgi:hypothetical protein